MTRDTADQQRRADAARSEDEVRGSERSRCNVSWLAAITGASSLIAGVQCARHLQRVRAMLRADLEHDAGVPHDRGVANLRLGPVRDDDHVFNRTM